MKQADVFLKDRFAAQKVGETHFAIDVFSFWGYKLLIELERFLNCDTRRLLLKRIYNCIAFTTKIYVILEKNSMDPLYSWKQDLYTSERTAIAVHLLFVL